jgi:hypothetical protein
MSCLMSAISERESPLRILMLFLAIISTLAHADLYKCKTPSGATVYSDLPCTSGTLEEKKLHVPPPATSDGTVAAASNPYQRMQVTAKKEKCDRLITSKGITVSTRQAYIDLCASSVVGNAFDICIERVTSASSSSERGGIVVTCTGDASAHSRVAPPSKAKTCFDSGGGVMICN